MISVLIFNMVIYETSVYRNLKFALKDIMHFKLLKERVLFLCLMHVAIASLHVYQKTQYLLAKTENKSREGTKRNYSRLFIQIDKFQVVVHEYFIVFAVFFTFSRLS